MQENYPQILKWILEHEGGWTNDPRDPGGATMKGIIQREYDAYRAHKGLPLQSVRKISDDELQEIYRFQYWDMIRGDQLWSGLDYTVADGAINSGIAQSVKWLQRSVRVEVSPGVWNINDDGIIGVKTLQAANAVNDRAALIEKICSKRLQFLKTIRNKKTGALLWAAFGNGWGRRVEEVKKRSLDMIKRS